MFFFPYSRGRFHGGRKSKTKKKPKANWFEELNASQCKELAKAAKIKASGTKQEIVLRLMEHDFVGAFGGNKRGNWRAFKISNIVTLEDLKAECRKRLLQVGGTKYDLVLRVVQHEHDTGGDSLKRAATSTNQDGQPVAKKRKPSKPSPSTMYNRVEKKIKACSQKKYQSYWGAKAHAPDVCDLMNELLYSLRDYQETDPKLVVDGCYAVVSAFVENISSFNRPGYCEDLESMVGTIEKYANMVRAHVTPDALDKLANVMLEWQEVGDPYGLLMEYDMEETADSIRNGPKTPTPPTAEEDKKPAASVVESTKACASPDTAATVASTESNETPPTLEEDKKPAAAPVVEDSKACASRDTAAIEVSTESKE